MTDDELRAPIITFLRTCLDQDEHDATIISHGGYMPQTWHAEDDPARARWMPIHATDRMIGTAPDEGERDTEPLALVANRRAEWAHIVRWDPARVMAEINVKRRIISRHYDDARCDRCNDFMGEFYPCETLMLLTLPYADQPGYDKAWEAHGA